MKSLALIGTAILLYVMLSSLFEEPKDTQPNTTSVNIIEVDLTGMINNQIRKTRWNGREVIILKGKSASDYSVYFNTGDSGNCPLFYIAGTFKDTCTGTMYDQHGYEKNTQQPKKLKGPDYYFQDSVIVIGKSANNK